MKSDIDILLCYRGRFKNQVERLDELLLAHDVHATYDREILTPDADYFEAEVEWFSLSEENSDNDRSWTGPLSAAVARSALVVFLIDTQDRSENVMNEITWAAQSKKPLFVVFNTKGEGHSEDWEGINLGMLQAFYGFVRRDPDVPQFGYHFITHEKNEGLNDRLTILVNRIISYFKLVKEGKVPQFKLDNSTTMADIEASPRSQARRKLQSAQEKLANAIGLQPSPGDGDPLQRSLDRLHMNERDCETRNGRIYPKHSPFSYPEESERERYRRTEALISATRPGPFENPIFLVMFARELVSLEMVLAQPIRPATLIGTLPYAPSNIPIDSVLRPDYAVLLVDSSYADFVYQMIKSAVMSWKITSPPDRLPVSMSTKAEDTQEVIAESPDLVAGFSHSLSRMLDKGSPGSSSDGPPPSAYQPALSMLIVFQKRFSIAVALARVLVIDGHRSTTRSEKTDAKTPAEWILAADAIAAYLVFESAQQLDSVDPTVACQSILAGLAAQHLIERSLDTLEPPELVPAIRRMKEITKFFAEYLQQAGITQTEIDQRIKGANTVATTLDMLWQSAVDTDALNPTAIKPAPRWQRR